MRVRSFQLNTEASDQLLRLRRSTGINKNNVLCRWAFCMSLRRNGPLALVDLTFETSGRGEINWETFAGEHSSVYLALLKLRLVEDGVELTSENLKIHLLQHINRGLGYLLGSKKIKTIRDLIDFAISD